MTSFNKKQLSQESSYVFPYHYLDLQNDAEKLVWNIRIEHTSYLRVVKNLLKPFEGKIILDAGCGDGRFCYEMKNEDVKIIGVDFSKKAIDFAKAFNPALEFFTQDLKNFSVPYEFDAVVLIETLEHLSPEDTALALKNLAGVIKTNGKLIVTVPSVNLPLISKHYRHFSEETLRETLRDYFKVVEVKGHSKIGFYKKIFSILRQFAIFTAPMANRIKLVQIFGKFLNRFFVKHLETGSPAECDRLIAVCEKK
ncbi:MAG: class I SAM-dependent methyltransferase [bacterium]|nr:class I SAM-dependent methyltransferase [bacterium]